MNPPSTPDYYEALQVSPRADQETIERVFRHLSKRLHPDNSESGNTDRFVELMEAYRTLSNPEQRASYDVQYEREREARWRILDQESALHDVATDQRVRAGILSLLYAARRSDPLHPGMGLLDFERLLGCPELHLQFHVWYLRENGWIQRLENGLLAITATGVDRVIEAGGPAPASQPMLCASIGLR